MIAGWDLWCWTAEVGQELEQQAVLQLLPGVASVLCVWNVCEHSASVPESDLVPDHERSEETWVSGNHLDSRHVLVRGRAIQNSADPFSGCPRHIRTNWHHSDDSARHVCRSSPCTIDTASLHSTSPLQRELSGCV